MALSRRVLMMLPFDMTLPAEAKARVLMFHRVKHLIEREIKVSRTVPPHPARSEPPPASAPRSAETCPAEIVKHAAEMIPVEYQVGVLEGSVGSLLDGLPELVSADILIVVLAEKNPNVFYEFTLRHVLRPGLVLIVQNKDCLPDYCSTELFIDWGRDASRGITDELDKQSATGLSFHDDTPVELQKIIQRDLALKGRLERALQAWENGLRQPSHLRGLFKYVPPGDIMSNWKTTSPIQIVRITWTGRSLGGSYDQKDLLHNPVVYYANDEFLKILGLDDLPNPNGESALTSDRMIERLRTLKIVDETELKNFEENQRDVSEKVFFRGDDEPAGYPLKLNQKAPKGLTGKTFLPTVVGKNIIGPPESTHDMYVAVVFAELPESKIQSSLSPRTLEEALSMIEQLVTKIVVTQIGELEERLRQNSQNSPRPPSSDSPVRAAR